MGQGKRENCRWGREKERIVGGAGRKRIVGDNLAMNSIVCEPCRKPKIVLSSQIL